MRFFIFLLVVLAAAKQQEAAPSVHGVGTPKTETEDDHKQAKEALEATSREEEPTPKSRNGIFRHRGITQAKKSRNWNYKPIERNSQYTGIQYSPMELAEYVFRTGDEEGVAVAVEELVLEGIMGRTDAINYLQDVKQNLEYIKEGYEEEKREELKEEANPKSQYSQKLPNIPHAVFIPSINGEKRDHKEPEATVKTPATTEQPQRDVIVSTSEPREQVHIGSTAAASETDPSAAENQKRKPLDEGDKAVESGLVVFYQVALEFFTKSILKDDHESEVAIARLIAFLAHEVENQNITPAVQQMNLSAVGAALEESVKQVQKMKPGYQPKNFDQLKLYQMIVRAMMNPEQHF